MPQTGTPEAVNKLTPFYATSDIIPTHSGALLAAGIDIPIYVFTRNIQGKISVGKWGMQNGGTAGVPIFQFFSPGGQTN